MESHLKFDLTVIELEEELEYPMAQFLPGKKGKTGLTITRGRRFKNITGVQVTSWSSIQRFKSLVLLGAKRKRRRRALHKCRARHRNRKSCREWGIRFGPRRSRLCVMRTGFSNRTTTTTPLALDTRANCTGPFALVARKGHEEFRVLIYIYIYQHAFTCQIPTEQKTCPDIE